MNRLLFSCAIGIAATGLLLADALQAQQGPPPAQVKVANATLEQMAPMTLVPGTVVSRSNARISAEVGGRLLSVEDVGTPVKAGDTMAVIEDSNLRLQKTELEAEVQRARARLQYLESEENRLTQLEKANLAAATQIDQVRSDRDVARSELAVNRARLEQVNDQIRKFVVKAPFDGVIVERLREAAELVGVGTEIVRVLNPGSLEIIARAPLEYMPYVSIGDTIEIRMGERIEASAVRTVVAVGDEDTHVFELRLDIDADSFPVGQTVRVAIPMSDRREVVAVPRDALVLRSGSTAVFVINGDNTARRVEVTTGIGSGELIEIQGEINAGDQVVVRGNERLQPGQPVSVMGG